MKDCLSYFHRDCLDFGYRSSFPLVTTVEDSHRGVKGSRTGGFPRRSSTPCGVGRLRGGPGRDLFVVRLGFSRLN